LSVGTAEYGCSADTANGEDGRRRNGDNASAAHELMGMAENPKDCRK
jgi:hypothetical protein